MTNVQTSFFAEGAPEASALARAAAQRGTSGSFDELHGRVVDEAAAGAPLAPLWKDFFDAAGAGGWVDLAQMKSRIARRVQDDGVTYNVHAEGVGGAHAWPLEPLPFLIDAASWRRIEAGAVQRARMLDAVLADVYGGRGLLEDGLLPASLVLAHPQYLRALHGCRPAGGVHLHVAAFDLARGADGDWRVVGQRTQAPSGLGYLLENRLIIAQQFSAAFRDLRVQRVASGFLGLLQGLQRLSPMGDDARVVLLTPGPHNETYFEHAFLSRYLGITLVEGGDLAVRGERLFLKTLHGLEPVHVLLRRVDDDYLDPLELRGDSALGVPGLVGVIRAGQVVVANAPGSGFLESPGLAAFWPAVARRVLGEELLLPSATSWWCGEESVWEMQRGRLSEFVVAPTFPSSATTSGFFPVGVADLSAAARAALAA
ncbi:MAG: circularly permuted type 2 ATP-grasp protein, partial [Burkholderiaceae bacterium]